LLTPALAHAAGGDLLWQDQFDFAGGQDFVNAVAAGQGRIVAVGSAQNGAGNSVIVRAYDAKSGTLLWKDRVDLAGGNDRATAVVMNDRLVVVAGSGVDATGNAQRIIRAYVPKSGALAWEDRSPAVDVSGLDMEGAHIVVTGTVVDATGSPQLLVRAYVAKSGALAWEDHTLSLGPSSFDSPRRGVTLHGGKAFVTRSVRIRPQDQEPY